MKDEVDFNTCKTFQEVMYKIDKYMDYYNNHRYQWGQFCEDLSTNYS